MSSRILHIFNPEHDLSLASRLPMFTPPHAARQLRYDLGFLPALWAEPDDVVLVDDVEAAQAGYDYFLGYVSRRLPRVTMGVPPRFCTEHQLQRLPVDRVDPWGWDAPLVNRLLRKGVPLTLLPSLDELFSIQMLSHRRTAASLLTQLMGHGRVGEVYECATIGEVGKAMQHCVEVSSAWQTGGCAVLKAPWSSSGRGVRFVRAALPLGLTKSANSMSAQMAGWLRHVLEQQGSVMVEPYYNKVCDFGMEFFSDGEGGVTYEGLSLFHTSNGAYTGNLLTTETAKRLRLARYVSLDLLLDVRMHICQFAGSLLRGQYKGPFGVDMMVVAPPADAKAGGRCLLHPCVELNLRRTMGHVALSLSPGDDDVSRVMRIVPPPDHYHLVIDY